MVFSSLIFLTVFLPLYLLVYYAVPFRQKSIVILVGSQFFYAWWRVDFLLLIDAITLVNYYISIKMKACDDKVVEKRWITLGIVLNLLTLGYYKYFNFGVAAFNSGLVQAGFQPIDLLHVILPIGISFHIFQAISYLIDIYRRDADIADSFWDFAAFSTLFPQLIAGPVIRYKDVADQFHSRTHSMTKFNEGAVRFMIGFSKKVLIADSIAPVADAAFALENPTMADAWLGAIAYALQLYFDFSGYSHMAIGIALMMGFRFIENFNHPYISRSITEFWRRWHLSLSTWLRDYLYIPLGGNRKGKRRTYFNLWLTMVLGGFWHGANWTFLIWGIWHGTWLAIERFICEKRGTKEPYPRLISLPLALLLVLIGWVVFRAPSMEVAMNIYSGMIGLNGIGLSGDMNWQVTPMHYAFIAMAIAVVIIAPHYIKVKSKFGAEWAKYMPAWEQLVVSGLFLLAFCKLIAQSHSPFLYFQF